MRQTKQKQIVADVLSASHNPLSVHDIHKRAKKRLPGLGIATVYREVARLSEAGELRTVNIPGDPPRYETTHHHHHHFKCTGCDSVFELEGCLKDVHRLAPRGFRPAHHDITLYGLCRECA